MYLIGSGAWLESWNPGENQFITSTYLYLDRSAPQSEEWPAPRKLRRVLNIPRHPTLSDANPSISSTVILSRPVNRDASSRTQVSQDFLGRPLDLLPWVGVHCNSFLGSRSSGILLTWPNHLSLFAPNITSIDWIWALSSTSTFFTRCLQVKDRPGSLFQPGPGPGPGSVKSAGTGILPGPGL